MPYRSNRDLDGVNKQSICEDRLQQKCSKFFPSIVHMMVNEGDDSAIDWVQNGEAFIVKNIVSNEQYCIPFDFC